MGAALIVYGVFATLVLVSCTISPLGPRVQYIWISKATLKDLGRTREDLIVVNVGVSEYSMVSEALRVPAEELKGFLRWVPHRSTLVLCGWNGGGICRDEIEMSLLRLGIESVYLADDGPMLWDRRNSVNSRIENRLSGG
jgi:hypothetical protein